MIVSMSVQPKDKIYWLDTNDGSIGEVIIDYAKVVSLNTGLEIQYMDINSNYVCTEKEISEKIEKDGVLYFHHKAIRDAYKEKVMKGLRK